MSQLHYRSAYMSKDSQIDPKHIQKKKLMAMPQWLKAGWMAKAAIARSNPAIVISPAAISKLTILRILNKPR